MLAVELRIRTFVRIRTPLSTADENNETMNPGHTRGRQRTIDGFGFAVEDIWEGLALSPTSHAPDTNIDTLFHEEVVSRSRSRTVSPQSDV